MSQHHSRAEKNEGHLRKSGRSGNFGQHKSFSGGGKGGSGGGGSSPAPAFSASPATHPSFAPHVLPANRSFKKSDNGQVGQSRGSTVCSNSDAAQRTGNDEAYSTVLSDGSAIRPTILNVKPEDPPNNLKIAGTVPKTVAAQPSAASSAAGSSAQIKGDASGGFLQFGTINPGIVNAMQIPARTASAPPNLDEQKRDQVCHDSFKAVPTLPIPSIPKPQQQQKQENQQPRKAIEGVSKPDNGETHPPMQAKRDMQAPIPSVPPLNATTTRSSVLPAGGMPMPVPFQQRQICFPFRGPNPPMPSQNIVASSVQMALPAGSVQQVPQQLFVPNIQSHPMQPQATMHQGQGLGFNPQLGRQVPPQLGSMGVGIVPQFTQQQPGHFGTQRRAVKITHPHTHEELKLDRKTDSQADAGSFGQRHLQNVSSQSQSQSQSLPAFSPSPQINYYKPPYNTTQMFFPPSSLHLTNNQLPTGAHAASFCYPINQNVPAISFMNPSSLNPVLGGRTGPPPPLHGLAEAARTEGSSFSISSSAPVQVIIKQAVPISENTGISTVRVSLPGSGTRTEQPKLLKSLGDVSSVPHQKNNKINPESSVIIQKPNSELSGIGPSFSIDKILSTVSSTDLTQNNKTEASPSLHLANVRDSLSIMEENDDRKKEAKQQLESVIDHPVMKSKKEPRLPQQQQDMIGACTDNGKCTSIPSVSTADSPTSTPRLLSADVEYRNSETVSKTDFMRTSVPSVFPLEKADQGYEHAEVVWNKLSLKEAEFGQKQENLVAAQERRGEISYNALVSSTSAGETVSTTGCLQMIPEAVNHEVKEKTPEKSICAELDTSVGIISEIDGTRLLSTHPISSSDSNSSAVGLFGQVPSTIPIEAKPLQVDSTTRSCELPYIEEIDVKESATLPPENISIPLPLFTKIEQNMKGEVVERSFGSPRVISGSKGKHEPKKARNNRKKKIKEILSKADAAGASDLYNAYKAPEEKLDATVSTADTDSRCSTEELKNGTLQGCCKATHAVEGDEQDKADVQDWEEAADASTPKLRTSDNDVEKQNQNDHGSQSTGRKKYSRDILLTFSDKCNDLPEGFDYGSDIADILMCNPVGTNHEPRFSPRRLIDRSLGASRGDKRIGGISDDDKWARASNAFHMDLSHGTASMNFLLGQTVNNGVLRNPRMQSPNHFANGILSGSMQSLSSQVGMARNNLDIDRWQHASGIQRGLFPSAQGPLQTMHKSSNRYEVRKSSDQEEHTQRQLKAILNKLTPQNFEKLFSQVKEVKIDNTLTLSGVISQIFDKALMEPTFCEMYADFCLHLASELPDFIENNEKITFRRLLLNKCQEEFERGEREQAEANKAEEEGEICQTEEEREEKRVRARRRMMGNIRLIGELYKKKMLTERIMHECIQKLLGYYQNPDEEDIESLCKLMSTIGGMIDHSKARERMDAYFDRIAMLSTNEQLSARLRFMLKDTIDLRKNKWQQRRKVEGPKKIEDVHKDAAQERQAQTARLARGPVVASRRGPPANFGQRGMTMLNSPNSQAKTSIRGHPTQARGSGSQDVRHEDRPLYESKVMPVPLPQRTTNDGSMTLGPQGGLAKGMSGKGLGLMPNAPSVSGHTMDRNSVTTTSGERPISSGGKVRESIEAKAFSEDVLRQKSILAIKEFYSARDEEEIVSCINELNSPCFYSSMVSLWVTDSFERKNVERNLLAELLVNLSKTRHALISPTQLIAGFESVLSSLEDAVNDAPKAAEFLGHIFGKIIIENVVPLKEIGRLIREGGEEPGSLVEFGLASEVLFGILDFIKTEKGDSLLNEIRRGSNLRLEDFRPPNPTPKSKKLDAFL
ncbi:eukaryotic translation initiation factor 4G isoform X2 [Dendrobium catenatum]|uniref:eukaryotic translation initiation factor 4G isoform X2 n=1 Tax=Dendrobium catenatum TaxID=906689 RepID=UPI0010A066A4|nr:eukaryotic translation initiation factor 4G isoform X2 [Dendrobium catenatum]